MEATVTFSDGKTWLMKVSASSKPERQREATKAAEDGWETELRLNLP